MLRCSLVILVSLLAIQPLIGHAVTLKIATIAPDGTTWMREMRSGAEQISQRTKGRVRFRFYPGGVMGNDKNVLRKVRIRQLHGGAVTSSGLARIFPDAQIYTIPFTFRSEKEVDYVRHRMDPLILQGLEKGGFVALGFAENGFAYLMSNQPLRTVDDLKGRKIWVPEGDRISRVALESMGVSPIPLPLTDVLTGLQTGLVDTIGAPPIGAIALQWHTRVKYFTDTPLMYLYGALIVDRGIFSKLNGDDQRVTREVMAEVAERLKHQTRADNKRARDALRQQGIEFMTPSSVEVARLHVTLTESMDRMAEEQIYSKKFLETMRTHLNDYRYATDGIP